MRDPCRQAGIKALQVQRRATQYVYNDYNTSRTPGCVIDRMGKSLVLGKTPNFQILPAVKAYLKPVDIGFYQEHTKHDKNNPGMS